MSSNVLILDHWFDFGFDPKIVLNQNFCGGCWLAGGFGGFLNLSDPKSLPHNAVVRTTLDRTTGAVWAPPGPQVVLPQVFIFRWN